MRVQVKVETLRDLIAAAGLGLGDLAQRLGLNESTVSLKVSGGRPLFLDEIGPIAAAINDAGRVKITEGELVELIGRANVKTRGYLE